MTLPQACTALPGGAPLPHPDFQFLQWGNENLKNPSQHFGMRFQGGPFGFQLLQRDHLGSQQSTTPGTESAGLAATSIQTSADRLTVCQTQSRDRSHAASLAGEHGCLAVLTDLVSSQRALPAHSTAMLQRESKYTDSLGSCASRKPEIREAWSENQALGSRRAHPIALAGLRVRPGAPSNC